MRICPTIILEITEEIERGNKKHISGPRADPIQLVSILCEELGEFAQASMKKLPSARSELVQVAAVAINYLNGTGPHFLGK